MLAFTTRIPLAVMIKQWGNRSAMPSPACGQCGMTCSKSSDVREYANFLAWAKQVFPEEVFSVLPQWEQVADWRGKMIAVCDYNASYTPGPPIWNEGYSVWWHLTNVKMLQEPIACWGNVGMWGLSNEITQQLKKLMK